MGNALVTTDTSAKMPTGSVVAQQQFVTMRLAGQMFGISVLAVQDVMRYQAIAPVPLAPAVIAGSINVRGRIVTAIDMRIRLGLPASDEPKKTMKIVVDYQHELYALIVDAVGDVLSLSMGDFERTPANMDPAWKTLAAGVFKLDKELLIILDVSNVIDQLTK